MNTVVGTRHNIQLLQKAYPSQGGTTFTLVPSTMQIYLHSFSAFNANTSACDVGLGVAHAVATWKLYIGNVNNGTPTNSTTAIQAGTATNIFDTTTNNGFMIESTKPFGYVSFTISQAQSGSPVYSYQYWNGASWATLNTNQLPDYTSVTMQHLTFNPPVDWAVGDGSLGVNTGYTIRVRSTTASGQAVKATALRVARWFCYNNSLPASSRVQVSFDNHPDLLESSEAIVPYFQTAANANAIEAAFQPMP